MIRTSLIILLMIFTLIQGCQQRLLEDCESEIEKMMPDHQCTEPGSEDGNHLTKEEAAKALLKMKEKSKNLSYALMPSRDNKEEFGEFEKKYNEVYEFHTDKEYDYDYTDYIVVEITYMRYGREIVEQWECNFKEGLCRRFYNHGNGGRSVVCGRFKKADNGEWVAVITGSKSVFYNPGSDTWEREVWEGDTLE